MVTTTSKAMLNYKIVVTLLMKYYIPFKMGCSISLWGYTHKVWVLSVMCMMKVFIKRYLTWQIAAKAESQCAGRLLTGHLSKNLRYQLKK
jgi:hypothetical protein